jgi:hypothetical protein
MMDHARAVEPLPFTQRPLFVGGVACELVKRCGGHQEELVTDSVLVAISLRPIAGPVQASTALVVPSFSQDLLPELFRPRQVGSIPLKMKGLGPRKSHPS